MSEVKISTPMFLLVVFGAPMLLLGCIFAAFLSYFPEIGWLGGLILGLIGGAICGVMTLGMLHESINQKGEPECNT